MHKHILLYCLFVLSFYQCFPQHYYTDKSNAVTSSAHSLQANIGYNGLWHNKNLFNQNFVGMPIGFTYEFTLNSDIYFSLSYANISDDDYKAPAINYEFTQHMITLSFGKIFSQQGRLRLYVGLNAGIISEKEKLTLSESFDELYPQQASLLREYPSDNSSIKLVAGPELQFKAFFTKHFYMGMRCLADIDLSDISERIIYVMQIGLVIGYTF